MTVKQGKAAKIEKKKEIIYKWQLNNLLWMESEFSIMILVNQNVRKWGLYLHLFNIPSSLI